MNRYNVIGTMSGTSLDGLDIAYCSFEFTNNKWSFKIITATTVQFSESLLTNLTNSTNLGGLDLMKLHNELGNFIGNSVADFIKSKNIDYTNLNLNIP